MYDFKDKKQNLLNKNEYMLARTVTMFDYENLPESIPAKELELQLQKNGTVFILEHDSKLYALECSVHGELDMYDNPIEVRIDNNYLNIHKTYSVDDGVLMYNDYMGLGLLKLYDYYNTMLVENDITFMLNNINTRIQTLISASDSGTIESAEKYLENIFNGDLGIIAENIMFDGVKLNNNQKQNNNVTSLIEYHQYLKASLYNEIGLNSNFNMKRERLSESENEMNTDILYPLVDSMLEIREQHITEINEKFNQNITVEFGSVWKKRKTELENAINTENFESEIIGSEYSDFEILEEPEEIEEEVEPEETEESLEETLEEIEETVDETLEEIELELGGEEEDEDEDDDV